jgi:co-chaperonin GroES (HSP10)
MTIRPRNDNVLVRLLPTLPEQIGSIIVPSTARGPNQVQAQLAQVVASGDGLRWVERVLVERAVDPETGYDRSATVSREVSRPPLVRPGERVLLESRLAGEPAGPDLRMVRESEILAVVE